MDKHEIELWYPDRTKNDIAMPTAGFYKGGYPKGAIVHFTAGHDSSEEKAKETLKWGASQGYTFFVIGPSGRVYQNFPLDKWGHHAGSSNWVGIGSGVSQHLVGIEVACAGKLTTDLKSWFGKQYEKQECRIVGDNYECPAGIYKKFTKEQEQALVKLILWLKSNNPKVFNLDFVLGHHEVAGVKGIGYWRKNDPGGSLSMTMSDFREMLHKKNEASEDNDEDQGLDAQDLT